MYKTCLKWLILFIRIKLTHWGRVTHICVSKQGHHPGRKWFVTWSAPSHYLNRWWNNVSWTFRNKGQWNRKQNSCIFIQEMHLKMSSGKRQSSCLPQCVNYHTKVPHEYRVTSGYIEVTGKSKVLSVFYINVYLSTPPPTLSRSNYGAIRIQQFGPLLSLTL